MGTKRSRPAISNCSRSEIAVFTISGMLAAEVATAKRPPVSAASFLRAAVLMPLRTTLPDRSR
jgi:hypothetical protein